VRLKGCIIVNPTGFDLWYATIRFSEGGETDCDSKNASFGEPTVQKLVR
jgi:hypothetical protein